MSLVQQINKFITEEHVIDKRGRFSFYPSEASVVSRVSGDVIGKCMRAAWYSWKGVEVTNKIDARGRWTFAMGHMIEEMYTEQIKRMGIWAGDNVKFWDPRTNISGEGDIFIFNKENKIEGVEIKSAYGYGFQKSIKVFPNLDNVMQVSLYLDYYEDIQKWWLIYHSRDTQENVEYSVKFNPILGVDKDNPPKGTTIVINDSIPIRDFYLEDIKARYQVLGAHIAKNSEPPRDFTYEYTKEQSEERFKLGKISKTKWGNVQKDKITDSDWQCLYCNHMDHCWKEKRGKQKLKK